MAPKSISLLFLILSVMAVLSPNEALKGGAVVGNWRPIENLKDPEVVNIAKFAVAEHNKQARTSLSLVDVVKGETQVVAGTNYRLVVTAKDSAAAQTKNYTAVVWYKPWQHLKQLISFGEI
ncbi:cysteine proteinase inhibitor 1 [Phtheirospermum japonicum]|uniref:Cysteine proteinase inhibitor 1 n=1 Tax=Phtheirospermum japonicum TaxID=374723 RepID=A0A830CP63_9LAMI|nr:cysteine proteinase inhibitor 1 [Phtheirospermum japonicum]